MASGRDVVTARARRAVLLRAGRPARAFHAAAVLGVLLLPVSVSAQSEDPRSGTPRTRFASFDVGFGAVKSIDASWGLSYGVAFDVANLLIRGASIRFGFRFWTADDTSADGRIVDLDDSVFDVLVKKRFGPESLGAYAGLGVGAHVVNARFADRIEEKEARDGFRIGLDGVLGVQKSLADSGFITLFLEGQGSLASQVSQVALHVGIRIRFDRLGAGG